MEGGGSMSVPAIFRQLTSSFPVSNADVEHRMKKWLGLGFAGALWMVLVYYSKSLPLARVLRMSTSETIEFAIVTILINGVSPVMLVWGWVRWGKRAKLRTMPSVLSLLGFIFTTASATLAVSCLVYDHLHPNPRFAIFYPLLFKMSECGVLTSWAGVLFSVVGVWRQSSLRWHAPVCALGTLAFWMIHTWFYKIVN
jgi:hypothetical protein